MLTRTPSVILINLPLCFLFLSMMFIGLQRQEYHWANHYYNSFENVHFIMNSLCNTLSYGPVCHFGLQRQEYLKSNHHNSEEETSSLWSCFVIYLLVTQLKIFFTKFTFKSSNIFIWNKPFFWSLNYTHLLIHFTTKPPKLCLRHHVFPGGHPSKY